MIQFLICQHGLDNGLSPKTRQASICNSDGLFHSASMSYSLLECLNTLLFFVIKRGQASIQVINLILQWQFMLGSEKKGFHWGIFSFEFVVTNSYESYPKSCQEACEIEIMLPTIMDGRCQCIKKIVLHVVVMWCTMWCIQLHISLRTQFYHHGERWRTQRRELSWKAGFSFTWWLQCWEWIP